MTRGLIALALLAAGAARADERGRLEEATMERRVFRHVLVGKITFPSHRYTWVLHQSATRARLELFCQDGDKREGLGVSLDGRERDEAYWQPPTVSRYAGTRAGETYTLAANETACPGAPGSLTLTCRPGKVSVRPAGAVLIPGKKRNDESMPAARWQPASRRTVAALRCRLSEEWPGGAFNDELVFAPGAGLEWAHENSDMVVQEGAYRDLATSTGR